MKICVIGYSGAGKSTLAKILGEKFNLPVLHLDATFWYGDWQNRTREQQSEIVGDFMLKNSDGWIIDGNYLRICPQRFTECGVMCFLNYNRFVCFKQARNRYKKFKGKARGDCPCAEKFDLEFALWILFKGRTIKHKKNFKSLLANCRGKTFVFKNRRALNEYLQTLDKTALQ